MKNKIILLTKTFPYSFGEEFLEEEVEYLANQFDDIYIVATASPSNSVQTRNVPSNVKCFALSEVQNKYLKYVKYVFRGIFCICDRDVKDDLKDKTMRAKIGVIYMAGKCQSLCRRITNIPDFAKVFEDSDIILYSYWFSDLPYVSLLLRRKLIDCNIKIVSRAHGYDLYDYRNISGCIPFRSIVMREIEKVYPCSVDGQLYLSSHFPSFSDKIEASYLGTRDCGIGCYEQHSIFRVVTCSAVIPLKRLNLLAEALVELEKRGETFEWTCIGDGTTLNTLKAYTKENIRNSLVIYTGRIKHDDVLELLKNGSFDLFVNVSESEGLPVSIMEAISFGIPILATDVGGTREVVIPDITGILLSKNTTTSELADKLLECKDSYFDRHQIRSWWEQHFNSGRNFLDFSRRLKNI